MRDGSSRPHRLHRPTAPELVQRVEQIRRQRWTGLRIAQQTGLSRATVSRILRRLKLSRIRDLEPKLPVQRYEHAHPGDLLYLYIKKMGRIARLSHRVTGNRRDRVHGIGWGVSACSHRRPLAQRLLAIYPDEKRSSVLAFLSAALDYYVRFGISFPWCYGPAYRSRAFAQACRTLGLKQRFTRPYTPCTNGKAERFIQTALREWAYARTYRTQTNAARSFTPGCTSTTGIDRMVVSAGRRLSADQLSIGTTC